VSSAVAESIEVLEAPIESPATITHTERYHGPLRIAYSRIRQELSNSATSDAEVLLFAVKAVNDTAGPEGLTPTLLVFGSMPRSARKVPTAKQIERAKAMERARDDIAKEYVERRLNFGLRYRGPYGGEREDLRNIPYGDPLAIYREGKGWQGPVSGHRV
jgi:hypothetical protein